MRGMRRLAPCELKSCTHSRLPVAHAMSRPLIPSARALFRRAPRAKRARTSCVLPVWPACWLAHASGPPVAPPAFTSAP
eukprot:scaffold1147_cov68-Phaeocystis_antarctica.AAC.5